MRRDLGFVFKKEAHKWQHVAKMPKIGDAYCFVAIERDTKLALTWHLGKRTRIATETFISKLRWATANSPFQLTTDGFQPYMPAVDAGLSDRVDFGQLVKLRGAERRGAAVFSTRCGRSCPNGHFGNPDPDRICTSHVERQNLTMRMSIRRLTRLTNAFSKKGDNLKAVLALQFAYCNFCRIHKTLRMTPAMKAGIADHIWEIEELLTAV